MKPRKILTKGVKSRIWGTLSVFLIVGLLLPFIGLAKAQIVQADMFKHMAQQQQLNDTIVPANRGIIYDRNMTVLAQSASAWKITMNPSEFKDFPEAAKEIVITKMSEILGIDRATIEEKASKTAYNNITLANKVEKDIRDKVLKFLEKPYESGVEGEKPIYYTRVIAVEDDVKRYYPYSTLASQTSCPFRSTPLRWHRDS